jgi:phosphotriesterase-related protein
MSVNTVTGPIEPKDLGWTLPHEHIIVAWDGTFLDSTLRFDWAKIEADAVAVCKRAKESGIKTIVDMTTIEMGRDVNLLRRVSEASGLQIVASTGLFADAYGVPNYFRQLTIEELVDLHVTEIEQGIGDTGIKAGVIKVATGEKQITELEDRLVRAGARAQLKTGVPILTHTGFGSLGDVQADILAEEGVDLTKVVIGHSDVSANLRYHTRIARKGARVGFDRIGLPRFMPDEIRAECIASMVRLGYVDQLTMSLDAHVQWCGRPNPLTVEERDFNSLADNFFPLLRAAGVSDDTIHSIMVDNVRRLFE